METLKLRIPTLLPVLLLLANCAAPDKAAPLSSGLARANLPARVAAFASLPALEHITLSPSGSHIAFFQNTEGKTYLVTRALDNEAKPKIVIESDNQKFKMQRFQWVGDGRLLVSVRYPGRRYGVNTMETHLLGVDRDGGEIKDLTPNPLETDGFERNRNPNPQFQDHIVGLLPDDPQHVLIALDQREPGAPDVYKLDIRSGERQLVQKNWNAINEWLADHQGVVRLGIAGLFDKHRRILVKASKDTEWRTLAEFDEGQAGSFMPLGFDGDPDVLYGVATHEGRDAIFRLNISEANPKPQLVFADPQYDVSGSLIYALSSGGRAQVVGAHYAANEIRAVYWDKTASRDQERIDRALRGRNNLFVSSSDDGHRLIISSFSPSQPPQIYLYDQAADKLRLIAETYPDIKPDQLATPKTVSFKARDGLGLQGYLTLPKNPDAKPLPLVVFPHGGPTVRDVNAFDYWSQFLANHGWAVLQVNFRGSGGYGDAFMEAGFRRWGMEMQDDIEDGVRWLTAEHIADPKKVCIVGGSYGGYAALMGIAKTPDLYRCAVSFAGVSDLLELLSEKSNFRNYQGWEKQLGGWWTDHQRLKETSPVNLAGKIRTPLLIVHGEQDRIVPVAQSRAMVDALKNAGFRDYEYVELPLGDHHLSREEDRTQFFMDMERFLSRHLSAGGGGH